MVSESHEGKIVTVDVVNEYLTAPHKTLSCTSVREKDLNVCQKMKAAASKQCLSVAGECTIEKETKSTKRELRLWSVSLEEAKKAGRQRYEDDEKALSWTKPIQVVINKIWSLQVNYLEEEVLTRYKVKKEARLPVHGKRYNFKVC